METITYRPGRPNPRPIPLPRPRPDDDDFYWRRWPRPGRPQYPPYIINLPPQPTPQPQPPVVQEPNPADEEHRRQIRNLWIGLGVVAAVILVLALIAALVRPRYVPVTL